MFQKAMQRLRELGARVVEESGRKLLYLPGNVNIQAAYPVDMYGSHVAANRRTHKSFLRSNHLGKFRKGK